MKHGCIIIKKKKKRNWSPVLVCCCCVPCVQETRLNRTRFSDAKQQDIIKFYIFTGAKQTCVLCYCVWIVHYKWLTIKNFSKDEAHWRSKDSTSGDDRLPRTCNSNLTWKRLDFCVRQASDAAWRFQPWWTGLCVCLCARAEGKGWVFLF